MDQIVGGGSINVAFSPVHPVGFLELDRIKVIPLLPADNCAGF